MHRIREGEGKEWEVGGEVVEEGREGRKEGVTLVHLPVPNTCQNYVENNKSHLEGEKKGGGNIACTI